MSNSVTRSGLISGFVRIGADSMNRGKASQKPTLGDSASDFMAQWKASEPRAIGGREPDRGTNGGGRNVEQTLHAAGSGVEAR